MGSMGAYQPPVYLILLACVVVQIGFGGYGIVLQKYAKGAGADALVFSILRDALCAPVLMIAAAIFERGLRPPRLRELPLFFVLGLTGMFGNQYFYIEGLFFSTPDIASIFQPCIPVFTALFAFIVCIEPLPAPSRWYQWPKILGILLGAAGAILMTISRPTTPSVDMVLYSNSSCIGDSINSTALEAKSCHPISDLPFHLNEVDGYFKLEGNHSWLMLESCNASDCVTCHTIVSGPKSQCYEDGFRLQLDTSAAKNQLVGIIFLLANCSCMAFYILIQKRFIFRDVSHMTSFEREQSVVRWAPRPVAVTAYSYCFGALVMAITAGIRYAIDHDTSVFHIPRATINGLAYAVLVSSALCYGLITWCNKYISSIVVASFWPVQVFVTIILSYFVFGENLAALEYVGMALIILGMLTVSYGNYAESKPSEKEEDSPLLINKAE